MQLTRSKRLDTDMTVGNSTKLILKFAAPLMLGNLFQQMYNTVDSLVVGNLVGKEALAAVGSTSPIINTLIGLFLGFSMGSNVVISQYYGAKDYKRVHDAVHTTIIFSLILSLVFTVVGVLMVPLMLRLMDTPADVLPEATTYLRIYFSGIIGLLIYNMGSGILRAMGDSKRPLYFLIFSAVVNTVLDLLFVIAFKMGVAGVALATIIAQGASAALVLIVLSRSDGPHKLIWGDLRFTPAILKQIVRIGLPSSIQQAVTAFSNVFVQSYINGFGSASMAGWSCYGKIDTVALLPMQSIAMASTTFVGQNIGAGKLERAKKGVSTSLIISVICTVILITPLIIFAPSVVSLFNQDPDVLKFGTMFLRFLSPFYVLCCVNQIYAGALRGAGDTRASMVIMLSSFVAFRQIYLLVVSRVFGTVEAVAFGYPAGWLVCSTLIFLYYKFAHWERRAVVLEKPSQPSPVPASGPSDGGSSDEGGDI